MQKWYVYREGKQIKVAHVDQAGAAPLLDKGCELGPRPFENEDEAETEAAAWRNQIRS